MPTQLTSKRYAVEDPNHAIEFCFQQGWTDGLPVVPPTEPAVRAMLDALGLEPDKEVCFITNRQVAVSAEKIAVNAVMAGCLPEHMPVVVAAIEALADPKWGYHGPAASTGGAAPLMIINGPIATRLSFNSGDNLFGPGWRSNATTGRAVRLVMRNVIGTLPGALDRGTVGHPGKYSYVIAENEAESPWTPLHVQRGFKAEESTVTVLAAEGPHQFYNQLSSTAKGVLTSLCDDMKHHGATNSQPQYVVVLAGEHMRTIANDGWSKADIQKFVYENTQNSVAHIKRVERLAGAITSQDEATMRPLVASPEDVLVVAAGGRAGAFSCYIPAWAGGKKSSQGVTKLIQDRRP
jgi:hypothetical protein